MAKSEVYSWRVAPEIKAALEHTARAERSSIGRLLERLVHEWLVARGRDTDGDETEQARRHAAAARTFGTIRGGNPHRSEQARALIRRRLARQGLEPQGLRVRSPLGRFGRLRTKSTTSSAHKARPLKSRAR